MTNNPVNGSHALCRRWLQEEVGALLGIDPARIDPDERFRVYGLDSLRATALTAKIAARLGRPLRATIFWEYPTIDALARRLAAPEGERATAASASRAGGASDEPIAIVGIGCRFPGGVSSPATFWDLLRRGGDAVREVPPERWELARFFDPDRETPGKMNTRWGGFVDQVDSFDAAFFGIAPVEAKQMDPQQRLLLELAWEALEDAGVHPLALRGTATSVFAGAMWSDYARVLGADPARVTPHTATGLDTSILSARISYFLGLQGPSLTVNTACSSSLVAVHLAAQSLRRGESTLALAGGVSLVVSPWSTVAMTKFGATSPDGRCRAFDARANGYVRGEGGGVLVLKTLSRALADGDPIYCLLVATAINNDGFSNGLTAPNPAAQEEVLRLAYANAALDPRSVQYVEAHGTGTLLGDPIEAHALGAVLGSGRDPGRPLRIGSVKTNLGHPEAAAGVAGLIKVALSMRHRQLPPSLHFEAPNPHIAFDALGLRVQAKLEPWPDEGGLLVAGVNSFGFGGTNCHAVVREFARRPLAALPLASDSPAGLRRKLHEALDAMAERAAAADDAPFERLEVGRGRHRAVVFGRSPSALAEGLVRELGRVETGEGPARPRVVFVCPGQGSQWLGMGAALLHAEPAFRESFLRCDGVIRAVAGFGAVDELVATPERSNLHRLHLVQPLLFALQVSLGHLLQSWGVSPDAVVGHSLGEVAAAHLAGILDLEDAVRVLVHRSRFLAKHASGGMLAVEASAADVERALGDLPSRPEVAAYNGPRSTVLSGHIAEIEQAAAALATRALPCARINADVASHCGLVEAGRPELLEALSGLAPREAQVSMPSTVSGRALRGPECGPEYWFENLRRPVRFREVVESIVAEGPALFVELSAHPLLVRAIDDTIAERGATGKALGTLARGGDDRADLLQTLGELHLRGVDVAWSRVEHAVARTGGSGAASEHAQMAVLSAKTPDAVQAAAARLATHLEEHPEHRIDDVAYSLMATRSAMAHRVALTASTREGWVALLRAVSAADAREAASSPAKTVFVFPGHGSQWPGMGLELLESEPAFREAMHACDRAIAAEAGWSVIDALRARPEASRLDRSEVAQPALFAMAVALAALWRSWGVEPDAVVGHSMGEVAAACVAGALSLRDAAAVICRRSALLTRVRGRGQMALVELSMAEAQSALAGYEDRLSVAVSNSDQSTVLSGEGQALDEVLAGLQARGVFCRRVKVDYASHSAQVDPVLEELVAALGDLEPRAARQAMRSTLTGEWLVGTELEGRYWADNLRRPVRFGEAIRKLLDEGHARFVEMSAHPLQLQSVEQVARPLGIPVVAAGSLRRGQPERQTLLESLGSLWVHGLRLDAARLFPRGARRVPLPTYPWQRERHWPDAPPSVEVPVAREGMYRLAWQRGEAPVRGASLAGHWAVVSVGDGREAEALAQALRAAGASAQVIALDGVGAAVADHVVCVWGATEGDPAGRALRAAREGLAIARALVARPPSPRLWWVTRASVDAAAGDVPIPSASTVWGLGRVLAQERPELGLTMLDVEPDTDVVEVLAREVEASGEEGQVAWRRGERLVARLARVRAESTSEAPRRLRTDGTCLVTGGLGGLGALFARRFAECRVKHLLLTGRRGTATPGAPELVAELEALGARVTVLALDVTDRDALARAIDALPPDLPLRAIVHGAAVLDDGVIEEQTAARFDRVISPKVAGAWNLHALSEALDLDLFVLFSSMAGALGSAGQSGYAAGNTFLDALASYRRRRGLPAMSLAWGPWAEIGLAASLEPLLKTRLARQGIRALAPAEGLALFEAALHRPEPQLMLASLDAAAAAEWFGEAIPPVWQGLLRPPSTSRPSPRGDWALEVAMLAPRERLDAVTQTVRAEVARVLSLGSAAAVPTSRPLKDLGLDSLMAVELRNALGRRAGRALPATLAFDHPTASAIARHLLDEVLARAAAKDAPRATAPAAPSDEPIAIIGMGCRVPGGATDPESLWRILAEGVDAVTEIPRARWDADAWYDPDPDALGKMTTRWGGFLEGLDEFEPEFFGLAPREAPGVDPQERLLLETAWEALERAGLTAESLMGSNTGVYVGLCGAEYQSRALANVGAPDPYGLLGTAHSAVVGRLSYWLGLKGPNMPIDTACSSSLVAVHLACQALRAGECERAIAGGVNVMLGPEFTVHLSRLGMMSPTGRCRAFSADADGYVRAEGAGVVVLERLSDALRRGRTIWALIRGTAVNQDGRSNGLTAPNGPSQQAVVREALRRAGVLPWQVGYVECHGTGTPLGDPIEVQALAAALSEGRPPDGPVVIGSLKSNVGHMEGAAGVGGLMKAVLALREGVIPKTLHVGAPNPHIPWSQLPVKLALEATTWPRAGAPRIAGVSSLGFSGTNAHAILEEAPPEAQPAPAPPRAAELVVLSARTADALRATAGRLREHLARHPEMGLGDVAFSLATTRTALGHRLTIAVPTRAALLSALEVAARGEVPGGAARGEARDGRGKLAWVFSGQGSQRLDMGRRLYEVWPAFREALDEVCAIMDGQLEHPLRDVMWAGEGSEAAARLDRTAYTQPAIFALQWALGALWRSWGVEPDVLAGHSIGEYAAACIAGVFSLADAARLVCARGRLMDGLPEGGAMVSIAAEEAEVAPIVAPAAAGVSIAAVNGRSSVVIAGAEADVDRIAGWFAERGRRTKRLPVSHAFHSPKMDPILGELRRIAQAVDYREPHLPVVSTLSGARAGREMATAEYWVRHARETVRFADAVRVAREDGATAFLELGAKPALLGALAESTAGDELLWLASLQARKDEAEGVLEALGGWFASGGAVSWEGVFPAGGRRVALPTYPWQRRRYWIDVPEAKGAATPELDAAEAVLRRLGESGATSAQTRAALPELLGALARERAATACESEVRPWLHDLVWRPVDMAGSRRSIEGRWIVLGEDACTGALVAAIARAGGRAIRTESAGALREALEGPAAPRGLLVVAGADEGDEGRALALEQLVGSLGPAAPRTFWITRGGVGTGPQDPPREPQQAVFWGLARTFALEHPAAWGGIMDLPEGPIREAMAGRVVAWLDGASGEDQVALRPDGAFAPRVVARAPAGARPWKLTTTGTVLVTGGLGGLGGHVARWLARKGIRRLVLASRRVTPASSAVLAEVQALGAHVEVAAVDAADRDAMRALLDAIPECAPLVAVFHTAGIADRTPVEALTAERLAEVLRAKRDGTRVLAELTEGRALEAFVCFSSIAGVWGSGGQAAYAAGNAYLDAWAQKARAAGVPALSVSWGAWAGPGMFGDGAADVRAHLVKRGLRAMRPEAALYALERALGDGSAHAVVADVDWAAFCAAFEARGPRPVLAEVRPRQAEPDAGAAATAALADVLGRLSARERSLHLRAWILDQCAAILGRADLRGAEERGFFDLGMDSLMVVDLRKRMERAIGARVLPSSLFDYPNAAALTGHLLEELALAPLAAAPPAAAAANNGAELETSEDVIAFINSNFERLS